MGERLIYLPFSAEKLIDVAYRIREGGPYAFTGRLDRDTVMAITRLPFEIALVKGDSQASLIVGEKERVICEVAPDDTRVIIHNHPGVVYRYPSSTDIRRFQIMRDIYTKGLETTGVLTASGLVLWKVINHQTEHQYWQRMPDYSRGVEEYFAYANQHGVIFEEHPVEKVLEYF